MGGDTLFRHVDGGTQRPHEAKTQPCINRLGSPSTAGSVKAIPSSGFFRAGVSHLPGPARSDPVTLSSR